jgi:hypothetical protein
LYKTAKDVGYSSGDIKRFSVLNCLKFSSVLDVGSGPCLLQNILPKVKYEAVDIREDSLKYCNCKTYTAIPNNNYDLICLFGTLTDKHTSKENYFNLLCSCKERCNKYLVFSIIHVAQPTWLWYTKDELQEIINQLQFKTYFLVEDETEIIVIGEI